MRARARLLLRCVPRRRSGPPAGAPARRQCLPPAHPRLFSPRGASEFAGIREKSGQTFYLQQLVYFTVNAVAVLLVIYKCKSIGLVPSTEGDWLEFISIGQVRGGVGCRGLPWTAWVSVRGACMRRACTFGASAHLVLFFSIPPSPRSQPQEFSSGGLSM